MAALMAEAIRNLVEREDRERHAAAAKRRILARIRNAASLS
jgi:hypothetical protein